MSKLNGLNLRIVLYEGPGSAPLSDAERFETMSSLLQAGFEVTRPAPKGDVTPADSAALLVLGRFDGGRPPQADDPDGTTPVFFRDLGGLEPDAVLTTVKDVCKRADTRAVGEWKPWFPVIDFDRCTNCMQCLSFCLFNVYGVGDNETIQVQNNDNCKTDCPACSRVCPEVAILFPKYGKGPINGDVVRQEDIQRESMKVDVSALLGGDIYASLKKRSTDARERFSTERDESRALLERKRCLKKLKTDLDIPDEVLMSLPGVGDIEERARRARDKAVARRARSQTVQDQRPAPTTEDWGI